MSGENKNFAQNPNEQIFDLVLTEALKSDCEREINLFKNGEEHIFNEKFEREIKSIKQRLKRNQNLEKLKKSAPKLASAAAALALFLALYTNPSVSAFFKNIMLRLNGDYNQYEFSDDMIITFEDFNPDLRPSYVPDGYRLTQVNYGYASVGVRYTTEDDDIIIIDYGIANNRAIGIDNENSISYSVTVNGREAVFHETTAEDRPSYLVWIYKGYAFVLSAQISLEEFVQIAESIKIS